ncbi:MAG: hypothetical protein ABI612_24910 [Betaproteobacteria bacterium]
MRAFSKFIAVTCISASFSVSAQAALIGKTLDVTYYHPDLTTPYAASIFSPQSFIVGAGVKTIGKVEGVTSLVTDFSDSQHTIMLKTTLDKPTWNARPFNGVVFTLLSPGSLDIASAVVDSATSLSGFDNSRVSFTNLMVGLNWQGLSYTDGEKVVVNFAFDKSVVPESCTYACS